MATVPLSGTDIRILSGVPFANDYKNTRWFETADAQYNYFQSKHLLTIAEANFQRIEGKHFIAVNASIDQLWGANYLMFRNTAYGAKWFYAFVTKLEYKQRNTTYVHFEIDVLQTWCFTMQFKPSYVVREHCQLWNVDGSPVINTVDEGLNYGTNYIVKDVENYLPYDPVFFMVIVAKTAMHGVGSTSYVGDYMPCKNGLPQPLVYYVHPFKLDGSTPNVKIGVNSVAVDPLVEVFKKLYKNESAVNGVVSIYVTEFIGDAGIVYDAQTDTIVFTSGGYESCWISDTNENTISTIRTTSITEYSTLSHQVFSDKYSGYDSVTESKLLMYPYTVLVMDDLKGNRAEFKNEYIDRPDIMLSVKGSLGVSNKISYNVANYLTDIPESNPHRTEAVIENAIINNSPNDLPIMSDYLAAYLQGNRNSIENQKNSIMWNGVMSGIGNAVGGVASAVTGNIVGATSAGVGIIQGAGNTVLQLQAIEAKQQDISNVPPSLVKMGGNAYYDYGNGFTGVFIMKKQITPEYQNKLSDFFKLYGYKVNEVKIPNFHTRQSWNYVQTLGCNIVGNFNNDDLQELKNIFDNGITLWHTDDVGNYSLANGVI